MSKKFPRIVSIVNNIQPFKTNIIFGSITHVLYGREYINEVFYNLKFIIGIQTFFQVNLHEAQRVVELIRNDIKARKNVNTKAIHTGHSLMKKICQISKVVIVSIVLTKSYSRIQKYVSNI